MAGVEQLMQSPLLRKFSHWFYGLPERDQLMLKVMAFAVTLFVLYFMVWAPVQHFQERSFNDLSRQRDLVSWIKQQEPAARAIAAQHRTAGSAKLDSQSMLSTIGNSAKSFSLELKRFEPEGDSKMRVWLEKVPFNQMILWLDDLDKRYGIQVDQISIDRDDTPGLVTARLSLTLT